MATTQIIYGSLSGQSISATTLYTNGNLVTGQFTGGTVSGDTIFLSGVTASTISATTISGGTFYMDGSQITKPYKEYTALLTQSGTSIPTSVVLENTIGNITLTRDYGPGEYGIVLDGGFPLDKTFIPGIGRLYGNNIVVKSINNGSIITGYYVLYLFPDDSTIYTYFYDNMFNNVDLSSFGDCEIPIEIRVYN